MHEIRLRTDRRTQLVDITRDVQEAVNGNGDASAALIYVPHTTAGVTINEHADPAVARDFEAALEKMVGDDWGWQHIEDFLARETVGDGGVEASAPPAAGGAL